ncbi:MAG: DUF58 domain-containing protein [Granulosicoccus sp.]
MPNNSLIKAMASRISQRVFRTHPEDTLPHVVTHQRVYIVPTKRGLAFLLALFLMLIASVNYALSLGYALCFILSGLFAATLLHTYKNLAGVEVHAIDKINAFAGDKVSFLVTLSNTLNDFRHGIRVSDDHGARLLTQIEPCDKTQAMLTRTVQTRGKSHLGRITLQSDWPLGLWTCWTYLHTPIAALVYPKPEDNPPPLPVTSAQDDGPVSTPSLDGEVSGVREYRSGDSMGSIAWKSAAKGAGLQVRTFESSEAPAQIVLSLKSTGHYQLEEQLSRLCAWVLQIHSSKTDYKLELPGETSASDRAEQRYENALKAMALYGTDS